VLRARFSGADSRLSNGLLPPPGKRAKIPDVDDPAGRPGATGDGGPGPADDPFTRHQRERLRALFPLVAVMTGLFILVGSLIDLHVW
jgi:hypothetical protein